jgi:DNA transformation protein and related proteins
MATGDAFASYCAELLSALGEVRTKRMFGGHGIYVDDVFIAIVHGETLYLKVDDQTRARFAAAGSREFTYTAKGQTRALGYWSAPVAAMDSPAGMRPWARLALDAALRAK